MREPHFPPLQMMAAPASYGVVKTMHLLRFVAQSIRVVKTMQLLAESIWVVVLTEPFLFLIPRTNTTKIYTSASLRRTTQTHGTHNSTMPPGPGQREPRSAGERTWSTTHTTPGRRTTQHASPTTNSEVQCLNSAPSRARIDRALEAET